MLLPSLRATRLALAFVSLAAMNTGCWSTHRYNRYARRYSGEIPFTLINDSPVAACYVRLSPSVDNNWGDDWLGPRETIPAGGGRTFAIAGGPAWDIQIQACDRQLLAEARQVPMMGPTQIAISQLRPPLQAAPPGAVYVQPLQKAYASSGN